LSSQEFPDHVIHSCFPLVFLPPAASFGMRNECEYGTQLFHNELATSPDRQELL